MVAGTLATGTSYGLEVVYEPDLREFIRRLPDLTVAPPTVHLVMLAVRSKKAKELMGIKIKDLVVERSIVRPIPIWRDRYFADVWNLAVLQHFGYYDMKTETKNLDRIPTETMGILATIAPRNVRFAVADMMKEDVEMLYRIDDSSLMELAKVPSRFFGHLHSHPAKDGFRSVTVDIDSTDELRFAEIHDLLSSFKIFMATQTSGGFHVVLDLTNKDHARDFYAGGKSTCAVLTANYGNWLEIQRDSQEPVPGTLYARPGGEHFYVRLLV